MMKKSNLFGASALELEAARATIEYVVNAALVAHESEYRGGGYFLVEAEGAKLILQANIMEDDGEVTEAEYPDVKVLLYVDGDAINVDRIAALFAERQDAFKLLRASSY